MNATRFHYLNIDGRIEVITTRDPHHGLNLLKNLSSNYEHALPIGVDEYHS